jgi:hypothetical protein
MKKYLLILAIAIFVIGLAAQAKNVAEATLNLNAASHNPQHYRTIYYTEDFESGATGWTHWDGAVSPNNWHIYNNGDAQGDCWWMGDPALASGTGIGGYYDHQYLVLDTPISAITAGSPNLTFKMKLNMEAPGASGEYDGWDSFNLRISTNSGISWSVIPGTLIMPTYDFANSYAFGSEHGEGLGVPAWGGVHEPWVTVSVDLSGYVGQSVKIRFAFASDPAYNTVDDPSMYGAMVDDIAFGSYTNTGANDGQMTWSSLVPTAGDFWHLAVAPSAPSPTHIMSSENASGTYVPYMLNYLMSPSITLPGGATQIVADFQMRGTYSDDGVFPDVDYFGWEVSPDNGYTWRYMSNPYADPDGMNYVYSGAPDNWASMINSYTLDGDITLFAGQTVKFRWYFQSNDTVNGSPLQIDDFQIFSVTAAPAPPNLVYPVNGAVGMPIGGFDLDWTASSLGALPEYYTVYMDMTEENLELATFAPTYTSAELTISLYNPVTAGLLTYGSNQRWYWRVGASIVGQDDAFSEIFRFDIVDASTVINTFPWTESFDGTTFPPTDWTRNDVDGDGVNWARNTTTTYIHSGAGSAYHNYSAAVPEPGQDGWLVTPPIQLPATGVGVLSWWNYNLYPTYMYYNGLWINNASPTDPNWVELWHQTAASQAWTQKVIGLADYAGQQVYFGFKYAGYDAEVWYIDDVNVSIQTVDATAPSITHLPLIPTLFDDQPYTVTAGIVDDPVWNNTIAGANILYSTDGGTTWSAPIAMTEVVRANYQGDIPAQMHGTTVTYKIEGMDSAMNTATTPNYSFEVNDPVWIQYDHGGTGYTGFPTYVWGPMIYYENPLYGTRTALKLLAVDGAVHNNNAGNPPTLANLHVYAEDLDGNLTDLITPVPVTFIHRTRLETDLSALDIQITSPYFWISYEDMPTGCYFHYDVTYNYTTLYLTTGGAIYYSTSPGEWCIGAYVQSAPAGLAAPDVMISLAGADPILSWGSVPGANSYNVYGAADPYAADPWTLLDNTTGLTYMDTTPGGMEFYKVTADTAGGTRGTVIGMPISKNGAAELLVRPTAVRLPE